MADRRAYTIVPASLFVALAAIISLPDATRLQLLDTSVLHFSYDGWIWKVRKPEVARPLGLARATS